MSGQAPFFVRHHTGYNIQSAINAIKNPSALFQQFFVNVVSIPDFRYLYIFRYKKMMHGEKIKEYIFEYTVFHAVWSKNKQKNY